MTLRAASSTFLGVLLVFGCSSQPDSAGNTAGAGGVANGGSGGSVVGQAGTLVSAGTMQGGASGSGVGGGASGSPSGGANAGGSAGAGGSAMAGGAAGAGGGGPVVKAGCADNNYDLCLDFETGIDAKWTGGTPGAIITTDVAHGTHSYRLYPQSGGKLVATNLGKITNQMWGRFYVHFKPGAPGGHGNIVAAFDQDKNWYEMGWQFDGMMGVWHASNNGERPLRSKPYIVDQWYCIETYFDGTQTNMPKWWIDGKEAEYYMSANEMLIPKVVTKFASVEVGFSPYAGLGLMLPDQTTIKDDRVLTDMAIDDVAFNTTRIGCITP